MGFKSNKIAVFLDAEKQHPLIVSLKAYSWAKELPIKPLAKKIVLMVIADYSTDTGKSYPTSKTFRRDTGMSTDAININLDMLMADGIITDTMMRVGDLKDVRVFQINPIKIINETEKAQRKPREKTPEELLEAEQIYNIYPRRIAKRKSLLAISRCIKQFGFEIVMNGTKVFADAWAKAGREINFCPHASTWFNQERFNDDPKAWGLDGRQSLQRPGPTFAELTTWVREREMDKTQAAKISTGLYLFGQNCKWIKKGQSLDWKTEFPAMISKWKTEQK